MRFFLKSKSSVARTTQGSVAIEFAILAPVFFLLLMGLMEIGIVLFIHASMEMAMSAGARLSTGSQFGQVSRETYIINQIMSLTGGVLNPGRLAFTTTTLPTSAGTLTNPLAGAVVVYRVNYPWHITTPIVGRLIGNAQGNINISAVSMTRNL